MNILIVEDVPAVAELIRQTLIQISGLKVGRVSLVHSIHEARVLLLKDRPELILLDEVLPGESSMDWLQDPSLQGIQVILVSAASPVRGRPVEGQAPAALVLGRLSKWGWDEMDQAGRQIFDLLQ